MYDVAWPRHQPIALNYWNWDEIEKLELEHVAALRSIIWLWCGGSNGLEASRKDGSEEKPVEIFHIIERFCFGRRRLHLFGRDTSVRPGWLTIGPKLTSTNYDRESYNANFVKNPVVTRLVALKRYQRLRPKSPPRKIGHQM
ncbi:hypothetical protein HELRODRAFT_164465 [Helobdella robusta]|uniref:N(6)-adenosine-methyltransferase non-catalytic subunit METTL14 n=1 Tax=Helobdella robusta TaxID=6412 RepID=T1EVG3_HELRO|nr:hypothetical protein HELRODRAFT_164465 [Helobdella robusta]ESN94600.1 hypothetical protein HELRODRAFT_164465 [Helobdella robusta]